MVRQENLRAVVMILNTLLPRVFIKLSLWEAHMGLPYSFVLPLRDYGTSQGGEFCSFYVTQFVHCLCMLTSATYPPLNLFCPAVCWHLMPTTAPEHVTHAVMRLHFLKGVLTWHFFRLEESSNTLNLRRRKKYWPVPECPKWFTMTLVSIEQLQYPQGECIMASQHRFTDIPANQWTLLCIPWTWHRGESSMHLFLKAALIDTPFFFRTHRHLIDDGLLLEPAHKQREW